MHLGKVKIEYKMLWWIINIDIIPSSQYFALNMSVVFLSSDEVNFNWENNKVIILFWKAFLGEV